jgi:ankyrin repeat protein
VRIYVCRVVQALVDGNADIHAVDNEGQTALHAACAATSIPCAALLLGLGAVIDAVDAKGTTPISCVFSNSVRPIILLQQHQHHHHRSPSSAHTAS